MTDKTTVKPHILEMAELIEKGITMDSKSGVATQSSDDLFETTLPEGLDMTTVNKVGDHNSNFIAAGAYAFGNMAVKAMAKHKALDSASLCIKMGGKDTVDYSVERTKTFHNPQNKDAPIVKMGAMSTSYSSYAGNNAGNLKSARKAVEEAAFAALSK